MSVIKLMLVVLLHNVINLEAANILAYYPCPSISHQVVFRPITLELIKRGHRLTVITTDPMFTEDNRPANLTEIDTHDVSYKILRKYFSETVSGKQSDLINQTKGMMDLQALIFEEQFKLQNVKGVLRYQKEEFDLLLLEAVFTPALALTHKFNAATILVSSFGSSPGLYEIVGAPTHPTIYHDFFRQRLYNLTLWEKAVELFNNLRIKNIMTDEESLNVLMKRVLGADIPPVNVLKNNVDLLFLNINPIWEGNYPVPPGVIHMGGLHQKPEKELPKDLRDYLDASNNGVIYFSFGTNVMPSLLPPKRMAVFEKVFSELPYNVIWKWDNENFSVNATNIKISKWLPQSDLLRHPNVKLFITQGGLQSTDEAITAGVPLIGIPMLGDQWYNVEKYVHHKIGVRLDFEDLTENKLRTAILEVAEDESYRNNIIRLRSLMQDQPQKPLERAMWWIEYVLRHGGAKHLRAPTANMSWSEFLELELVGCIALAALSLLALIVAIAYFVIRNIIKKNLLVVKLKES